MSAVPQKSQLFLGGFDVFIEQYRENLVRQEEYEAGIRRTYRIGGKSWHLDPARIDGCGRVSVDGSCFFLYEGEARDSEELPIVFALEIVPEPRGEGGFVIRASHGEHVFYISAQHPASVVEH